MSGRHLACLASCLVVLGCSRSNLPSIASWEKIADSPASGSDKRLDAVVALGRRTDEVPCSYFLDLAKREKLAGVGATALLMIAQSFDDGAPYAKDAEQLKAFCRPLISGPFPNSLAIQIEGRVKDEAAVPVLAKYFTEIPVSLTDGRAAQEALTRIGTPEAQRVLDDQRKLFKSLASRKLSRNESFLKAPGNIDGLKGPRAVLEDIGLGGTNFAPLTDALKTVGKARDMESVRTIRILFVRGGPWSKEIIVAAQDALANVGTPEAMDTLDMASEQMGKLTRPQSSE